MHLKRTLSIKDNDLVAEIGGGANPYHRSDVLLDKFPDGTEHAWQRGDAELVIDRPFIHFDGLHTPFWDKQCDYIMLSHVIEHIPADDLDAFMSELNRIGKAGYIEAPSVLFEHMAEVPAHVWFVHCIGDCVYLAPRTSTPFKRWLKPVLDSMSTLIEDLSEIFFTGLEWRGSVRYQICERGEVLAEMVEESVLACMAEGSLQSARAERAQRKRKHWERFLNPGRVLKGLERTVGLSRQTLNRRTPPFRWEDECVCPVCKNPFSITDQCILCSCGAKYRILPDSIPSFYLAD